ncbi:hypothetical protein BDB00DRAFT_878074 [Zychaea mexicana]|uniref:uncharacterized protein n=1 Tax=Zychaea mexicana TaxID=64656 RepID=UPI0022FE1B87|nr:uncharacterized protein BDB00DRAFT_878074 [Zychaea mexicana]KAI9485047.1 hypothetical protein BDB00DRAFT_878074 [Zychaea mexicana]
MPKERRESKKTTKPYERTKKSSEGSLQKRSKFNPKTLKLKNEALTDKLDDLMTDLSAHLNPIKKKKQEANQGNVKSLEQVQAAQREFEKVNNDMEDAMGLLTKL